MLTSLVDSQFRIKIVFKKTAGLSVAEIRSLIRAKINQDAKAKGRPLSYKEVMLCTSGSNTSLQTWDGLVNRKLLRSSGCKLTVAGEKKLAEVIRELRRRS